MNCPVGSAGNLTVEGCNCLAGYAPNSSNFDADDFNPGGLAIGCTQDLCPSLIAPYYDGNCIAVDCPVDSIGIPMEKSPFALFFLLFFLFMLISFLSYQFHFLNFSKLTRFRHLLFNLWNMHTLRNIVSHIIII